MELQVPKYVELPETIPGYRCSWAYFNSLLKNSAEEDVLGTLNFLTSERRCQSARDEVLTGQSIPLDLPIDHFVLDISAFGGRSAPEHSIKALLPFANEDTLRFNTQSSSQWDGFRHFGIRSTSQYYNGNRARDFQHSDVLGIDAWVKHGGIMGRGVLIDVFSWAECRGESLKVNEGRGISLAEVQSVLAHQGTTIKPGDILIFRTGWLKWYNETAPILRHQELCLSKLPGEHSFIGLSPEYDFVEWLWNNEVAAVAGDQVAFECTPPPPPGGFGWLHEHLLAALGCPIGELWDTEALAQRCKERNRYSFFLVSSPLNIRGGVASPANAVAVM